MDARITSEPIADAGSSRHAKPRRATSRLHGRAWLVGAAIVLALLLVGFTALQLAVRGKVGRGVRASGIGLQGQTLDQATATLERKLAPRLATATLQTGAGAPLSVALTDLGMRLDARATAEAALARGRHRLPGGAVVWLPGGGGEVAPVLAVRAAAFSAGLAAVKAVADTAPRDARLTFAGGAVKVVPSTDGRTVDALALGRAIRASVAAGRPFSGPVPMMAAAPRVTTAMAQSRAGAAATYLATPVTLRYRETSVKLTPSAMADMLTVNTGADAASYPLTFDNERARTRLKRQPRTVPVVAVARTGPAGHRAAPHRAG